MKRISEILSVLFSPLLVPTYGMILAAFLTILRYLPVNLLCTAVRSLCHHLSDSSVYHHGTLPVEHGL